MNKIIKLSEQIEVFKSIIPFEVSIGDKLMSVIFISSDENIHYSIICKNNDNFSRLEKVLYDEYPEYKETENYFIVNGKKINRFKTLEENNIKNNSVITLQQIDNDI